MLSRQHGQFVPKSVTVNRRFDAVRAEGACEPRDQS